MKLTYTFAILALIIGFSSCGNQQKETMASEEKQEVRDSVIFSFSFMGCNRVDRGDVQDSVPSTANKYVLERILAEMAQQENKPELFFFLGDLVLAESTTEKLNHQLEAWVSLYDSTSFHNSGIELVAVPGNHEMLYAREVFDKNGKNGKWKEFPLAGSTDIWLNYMKEHMPKDRDTVASTDTLDNRLTFSFIRHNVGFVVMNTDSYNPPNKKNPYGLEGMIPTDWIIQKIDEYKANPNIDHVFVLGHKPYYVDGKPNTGHHGIPEGPILWPAMESAGVVAMLSAHLHDYQRLQPINDSLGGGTYQVIAGNGGSSGTAPFFGYSTISIMSSGAAVLHSVGFCKGDPYTTPVPENATTTRDSTQLTWAQNPDVFNQPYTGCD
ncbi:MAG: metallophosphoesterase [Bacteroidota bacterium]